MKKSGLIILMVAMVMMSLQVFAQKPARPRGTPAEMAKKQGDEWQKRLGLSDDEKAKFVEAKMAQLTKIQGMERSKENRAAVQASAADFEAAVKQAFTPEHFDAWQKTREELKKNRQERRGGKGGQGGQGGSEGEKNDLD